MLVIINLTGRVHINRCSKDKTRSLLRSHLSFAGGERKVETYKYILGALALGSSDDSGGNHELFPSLGQVEVVDTILVTLVDVGLHLLGHVLSTNVDLLKLAGRFTCAKIVRR
jgi:hypothetical protein